jgi:glycosyltransferase involved in cell wall biosynthesis
MRVAIDNTSLISGHRFRGLGWYTQRLLAALPKSVVVTPFSGKVPEGVDLIHYPAFTLFQTQYPRTNLPTVVTLHDLIPLKYPEHYPLGLQGRWSWWQQRAWLKRVEAIITDSRASKRDIVKLTGIEDTKVRVVYLAADAIFSLKKVKAKLSLPKKFVLYVGDLNWNKNVVALAKMCLESGYPLVVVGKQAVAADYDRDHIENRELVEFQRLAEENPRSILRLGYLSALDLLEVYQRAAVYCQPSHDEGFGLPVVEAMASGCPVVSSGAGSLSELTGEAALDFSVKSLTSVWESGDMRKKLAAKGVEQAKKFSWQKTAEETIKVYKDVVNLV